MVVRFVLKHKFIKAAVLLLTAGCLTLLANVVVSEFTVATLSDPRTAVDSRVLTGAVQYYPHSARMLARLTELERRTGSDADLANAEEHIRRAIKLSPNDYSYRLILTSIREARGDYAGAEAAVLEALTLAPSYSEVYWKAANLRVRAGKIEQSLDYFRFAAESNPLLVKATLDLVWTVSKNDFQAVSKVVEGNANAQIPFARFLIEQNRFAEAADVFTGINSKLALQSPDTPQLINALIKKNQIQSARDIWTKARASGADAANAPKIWNGNFETHNLMGFEQFEWNLKSSVYARVGIDEAAGHSGTRALLTEFAGRDTTRLDGEVAQLVALVPDVRYQLEFFVKTENFRTPPDGPRVVVSSGANKRIAASEPIAAGSSDWKRISFNFVAPRTPDSDASVLIVSIKRQPQFSYDEPTRGRVWWDDFTISEAAARNR